MSISLPFHLPLWTLPLVLLAMGWFWYQYRMFMATGKDDEQRQRLANDRAMRRGWIAERRWEARYLAILGWSLDKVTRFTRDAEPFFAPAPGSWRGRLFGVNPWTEGSYLLCLRLAFLYPFAGFLIGWALTGAGALAGQEVIDPLEAGWRVLALAAMVLMGWLWFKAVRATGWAQWGYWLAGTAMIGLVGLGMAIAGAPIMGGVILFILTLAMAASAGAGAGTTIFFIALAGPVGMAILSGADTITAWIGALVIFFIVVTFGIHLLADQLRRRLRSARGVLRYWLGFNLLSMLAVAATMVWFFPHAPNPQSVSLLGLIFLGILPMANAALDWLSLGVTRGLLSAIRNGHHAGYWAWGWALVDMVLALVFLFLIISVTLGLLAGLNAASVYGGGEPVLDLKGLLDGLAQDPTAAEFGWIHFMMLSTLLPTLAHFLIAGVSIVLWLPERMRIRILADFDKLESTRLQAFGYFSLTPLVAFAVSVGLLWLLYWLVSAHHGLIGGALLTWARALVGWLEPSL